ncbi:hypothetical protein SLEP1_g39605 [Rubroshorea leprosula]|uniref:Integrase catalytic domain-containing protein n=1 Tax=Rubroshorea leprosula TaxID=152421 RepID=A0AAV5L137_9ROSI|nr:hypothetical protein SLEP1_g39605 [Rubroshorea leprosula]
MKIIGENRQLKVVKGIMVVAKGKLVGNLYRLVGETLVGEAAVASTKSESSFVWHKRSHKFLDLIHADTCQVPAVSIGGCSYFVTFIDDFSRKVWIFMLKRKSDAFEKFKKFKALVENQKGTKIKCLRTDNGGEFCSKEFDDFCNEHGIKRHLTVPGTPQQNGVAERMNRTLMERARCMMSTAKLGKEFWAKAVNTACYLINRSPTISLKMKTPEEVWSGKPANYSFLRVFGCDAYVWVPKEKRTKVDKNSKRCIFLGYETGTKGYKLWDPTARKLIISRDVVFNEDVFQCTAKKEEARKIVIEQEASFDDAVQEENIQNDPQSESKPESELESELLHEGTSSGDAVSPRPRRAIRPPARYDDYVTSLKPQSNYVCAYLALSEEHEPTSFKEACESVNFDQWRGAMEEEMESLHKNKTWDLVQLPEGRKAIGCRWIYKLKKDSEGNIERYKARLMIKGVVLAFVASLDLELEQLDVKTAFLHDDMIIAGNNPTYVSTLKAQLAGEFDMKDSGAVNQILGMKVFRDRKDMKIWLNQKNYIERVLQRFNMQNAKPVSTPFPVHIKLSSEYSPSTEAEKAAMSRVPYSSAVGSLMFAMVGTRPDIAQAVEAVSKYMANPGRVHWDAVKWILRYLKDTSSVSLCYRSMEPDCVGFVDADFAGDRDKRRSTSGNVFIMAGGAVSWESKLQPVVALSTTEAEYISISHACKEAIWLERLLAEFKMKQDTFSMHCDSQSALLLAKNPTFHSCTKHIDVRYHFVRQLVEDGKILLHKVHTSSNPADMLTKPVARDKFNWCKSSIGLEEV